MTTQLIIRLTLDHTHETMIAVSTVTENGDQIYTDTVEKEVLLFDLQRGLETLVEDMITDVGTALKWEDDDELVDIKVESGMK